MMNEGLRPCLSAGARMMIGLRPCPAEPGKTASGQNPPSRAFRAAILPAIRTKDTPISLCCVLTFPEPESFALQAAG
jgi:hypothetical protein